MYVENSQKNKNCIETVGKFAKIQMKKALKNCTIYS